MTDRHRLLWLAVGMLLGAAGVSVYFTQLPAARAANDRYEDYIMSTGPAAVRPVRRPTASGCWTTAPASCWAPSSTGPAARSSAGPRSISSPSSACRRGRTSTSS